MIHRFGSTLVCDSTTMSRRIGPWVGIGVVLCLAIVGGGCKQGPFGMAFSDEGHMLPPPEGPGLVAAKQSPIPDVPHPIGFVLITSQSRSELIDGRRYAEHMYQGQAQAGDIVRFYRRVLPRHGWKPGSEHQDQELVRLNYAKGAEDLTIQIARQQSVVTCYVVVQDRTMPVPPPMDAPDVQSPPTQAMTTSASDSEI